MRPPSTIDVREDGVFRAVRRRQRELEGGACSCATRPTRAAPAQSTFLLRFLLAVWVHTLGGLKPDAAVSAVTKWFVLGMPATAERNRGSPGEVKTLPLPVLDGANTRYPKRSVWKDNYFHVSH